MTGGFTIERVDAGHARVGGRMGFAEATSALECSHEVLDGALRAVDIDVSALDGIDSATLAVLLAWAAHAAKAGATFRLSGAPTDLRALAHLCDAEALLGIG